MNCQESLQIISQLLDGELTEAKQVELHDHLKECWHCAEVKEKEQMLKNLISQKLSYSKKVPQPLYQRIMSIIH